MKDILLLGYYGFKNSGDDALLLSIIQQLKKYDDKLSLGVLSFNPRETEAQFGIRAVDRNNVFKVIKEIISSKRAENIINDFSRRIVNEPLCIHCSYKEKF